MAQKVYECDVYLLQILIVKSILHHVVDHLIAKKSLRLLGDPFPSPKTPTRQVRVGGLSTYTINLYVP